jgi:hypothetical protein
MNQTTSNQSSLTFSIKLCNCIMFITKYDDLCYSCKKLYKIREQCNKNMQFAYAVTDEFKFVEPKCKCNPLFKKYENLCDDCKITYNEYK